MTFRSCQSNAANLSNEIAADALIENRGLTTKLEKVICETLIVWDSIKFLERYYFKI